MEDGDLDELVHIWERWTNYDALLRQVWQTAGTNTYTHRYLLEQLLLRINLLTRHASAPNVAALAASLAGTAVVLALEDDVITHHEQWQRIRCAAHKAHQEALAAV